MKHLCLSLVAFFLGGVASAAEGPSHVAGLFDSAENIQLVRSAEKVDACILRHVEAAKRADGSVDRSTERYEETAFVTAPAATANALRDTLLDEKTYDWKAGNGGRRPQFYIRLRFHRGDEIVAVDFCFMCHVLSLSRHGRELGHANFGPNSDLFLQAFVKLFPGDQPLKDVAKEAGLPL